MSKPLTLVLSIVATLLPLMAVAALPNAVVKDWEDQYRRIEKRIADGAKNQPTGSEMLDRNALILKTDRDPLDVAIRRTRALLGYLKAMPGVKDGGELEREFDRIVQRSVAMRATQTGLSDQVGTGLYAEVRNLGRRAAFSNPLLSFDDVLFVERKCVGEDNFSGGHMTTASFGHTQIYGGGLYIARNIKSGNPVIVNVLKDSVIENGPWKGQKLAGGAFTSPDLSFDGKEILFAYAKPVYADRPRVWEYTEENSFHIFRVNIDGSRLVQLTTGNHNDFDPCCLPGGRIVFISTRTDGRGPGHIYSRCFPDRGPAQFFLHSMNADGSDIIPLSFHETDEWHIRSVPRSAAYSGSSKYVATAGPHHGEPFGALVLIDVAVGDDGLTSQVKRITPNRYPESEVDAKTSWEYGTPWPLSADFYLANHRDGLYLLDRFGNCELICKTSNKALRPIKPIPLRPRPKPPVIPTQTWQGERAAADAPQATIAMMNVYDGDLPWPKGTKFKELRIIQYFPKSTQPLFQPTIGYAEQSLARMALGTVPVEEDGSAYFEAPVGKAISFQLLDQRGLAVQGMRSVTYVHPGERLTCVGCHESKWKTPGVGSPLASRRAPSRIQPEVGGLEPLNFHRLVKPVVQAKCAGCHKEKAQGPDMSYGSLGPYAFYLVGGKPTSGPWLTIPRHGGSRNVPGKHGAYGAPLLKYLDSSHYGVDLTQEELRHITLWLDCNSNELGAYQDEAAQRRGEIVWPVFDLDPGNILGSER
jgi:hypothetical protein